MSERWLQIIRSLGASFDEFGEVDKSFYIYEIRNGKFKLFEQK